MEIVLSASDFCSLETLNALNIREYTNLTSIFIICLLYFSEHRLWSEIDISRFRFLASPLEQVT